MSEPFGGDELTHLLREYARGVASADTGRWLATVHQFGQAVARDTADALAMADEMRALAQQNRDLRAALREILPHLAEDGALARVARQALGEEPAP